MNTNKNTALAALAAVVLALPASAATWELIQNGPFPLDGARSSEWQSKTWESAYLLGGGLAAGGREDDQPASTEPTLGKVAYRLEYGSFGFGISELQTDFDIGDYCTDIPEGVDWEATKIAITNSPAYKNGYIYFVDSATEDGKRVLFTRGGGEGVSVPWMVSDGAGGVVANTNSYTVGSVAVARPYRIFWTEDPFDGPRIDLSANPHIRLLGDPDIVTTVYEANYTSGTTGESNIVRGVTYDSDSQTLRCYAKTIDEANSIYDGPEGQFVLAYYDTGSKDNLVATIVVEATEPSVTVLKASVGEILQPNGGGYDIDGLESEIVAGDDSVTGDDASPFLYKHEGKTNWSPKDDEVFAISPTDETTTTTGVPASWRAAIYWKAPDDMNVLWPFEKDWYQISWPDDAPRFVISGDDANPGLPIFCPTNYTTSILDYQDPANIAEADTDQCVSASAEGWFTIKMIDDDNIWMQPVKAVLRTNPEVAATNAPKWSIGTEVELLAGAAALNSEWAAEQVDLTLPGYIYEAASTGRRNWNPRLYHEPAQDSQTDDMEDQSEDRDRYAELDSSIYLVNTAETPVEVWWSLQIKQEDMAKSMRIPCCVQRYEAKWPDERAVQKIVIAAQNGSDGRIPGSSLSSMLLGAADDTAELANGHELGPGASSGLTFGLWAIPSPSAAESPAATDGLLATLYKGDEGKAVAFRLTEGGTKFELSTTETGGTSWTKIAEADATADRWSQLALAVDPATNGPARTARFFANAEQVGEPFALDSEVLANDMSLALGAWTPSAGATAVAGATGVALDGVSAWLKALDGEQLLATWEKVDGGSDTDRLLQCRFGFDGDLDLAQLLLTTTRYAADEAGWRTLVVEGPIKLSPGSPALFSGIVKSDGDVDPEIYYENDEDATGFNPNDEHAFLTESNDDGGKIVHALRCDLGTEDTSRPLVLVMFNDGGKGAMRTFGVQLTNEWYDTLASERTAGLQFTPPYPLSLLDEADNEKNFAVTATEGNVTNSFGEITSDREVVYFDRHHSMWARRDGAADAYYYYAMQEGFWLPDVSSQPATGTFVPWLCRVESPSADVQNGSPIAWRWNVEWPDDSEIPTMRVAQTLTKATGGLPEVWSASSMAVVFPAPVSDKLQIERVLSHERVVHLIDPTVKRTQTLQVSSSFPDEYGFTLGSSGTTQVKKGKYYFTGLAPSIADRFYVDAANQKMCLVGQYVEKNAGGSYLQLNVLTDEERAGLLSICKATGDAKTRWDSAVNALATEEVQPNKTLRRIVLTPKGEVQDVATEYSAVDHYGLVASGEGTGYVTLIENDSDDTSMVKEGSTISMHVIKVVPELYADDLTVLTDPMNKLSEQLTVMYNSPFGDAADDYEFQWRRIETQDDGSVPTNYDEWRYYPVGDEGTAGRVSLLLGADGADLKDLQNMYYVMRYRAKADATAYQVVSNRWSDWCGPTLAEGWVQRVLNSVTPFAQRCADFSEYESDIAYSMLEQIGRPYEGDVALNNDNLNDVGLLELYRTVLNKAEKMSLAIGAKTDAGVNKQLLLAASRIAELYGILGDEAYSDAKNPTVSQVFSGTAYDADSLPSSVFCFQNQLPTLLDEELALLRGRTKAVAPNMTTSPYYNRLIWNFTKGVTEGEVAYVNNYGIYGSDGEITQEQAAKQYPQGHGDAYGHYLSMVKSFYHLVRNPYFDWYASMMEMLVGSSIVNVDYFDEEKFAEAAGKLARTAADTMDLTARKAWKDGDGVRGAGYFDADGEQAFGYGEWATRAGYGAICNWMVVNSLLPTNGTPVDPVFEDKGVKRINRSTASSLRYLPEAVAAIEDKLVALDSGMNPLGLSDNAIPFDMDPTRLNGDHGVPVPHFEQILERAEKALGNAQTVLDYAQEYGSRLAQIALEEHAAEDSHEELEKQYKNALIAIYGTPLDGDIGPGGTYEQGYDGPDLYHYQYIDLGPYGLSAFDSELSKKIVVYKMKSESPVATVAGLGYEEMQTIEITYTLTPDGIPQAASDMGVRTTEGSIQTAYRDFICAYRNLTTLQGAYEMLVSQLETQLGIAKMQLGNAATDLALDEILGAVKIAKAATDYGVSVAVDTFNTAKVSVQNSAEYAGDCTPSVVGAGMTVITDPSSITKAVSGATKITATTVLDNAIFAAKMIGYNVSLVNNELSAAFKMITDGFAFYNTEVQSWERLKNAVQGVVQASGSLVEAYQTLVAAEQAYRAEIAKGDRLQEELAMVRRHWANEATAVRYADMYDRIQRNDALSKYTASYDAAQRYVYALAKVYDYETGLLSSDPQAGDPFLREIVAARSLGEANVATESGGTLWDAVTRMKANWDVLKGRLGVNNPETTTKWFSLRYSHFRILPDAAGDEAWRNALRQCWRDDLWADPEIARYCQPPQSDTSPVAAEPGLVIPFSTAINLAENFFGRPLLGGETTYSSSDYAVKLYGAGIRFDGYDNLAIKTTAGLATEPNVYLVPVGADYMRAPAGTKRETLAFNVVDQVMPVPYDGGALNSVLQSGDWIAALSSGDSAATIRRHSTMPVLGGAVTSTRLVGRSVWNDRWLLVIPASSLSSDRVAALKTFIEGLDTDKDGQIDIPGVSDIELGFRAYSRSGN